MKLFTPYQIFVIIVLSLSLFTVVVDFMVLSPLGAILMPALSISPAQFGLVVSAYAFSAGASGLLAAGFADRFDRKAQLLFFYAGFLIGTVLCAMAPDYQFLLIARIITGIFGGVIGSICFAIIADLFRPETRGTVMGWTQMSFAASQVLGIPIGLLLANEYNWHAPFWMIVAFGIVLGIVILIWLRPVSEHLRIQTDRNPFHHLVATVAHPRYWPAFLATTLLATGGFMLMPFGSAFAIHNLGLTMESLPSLYLATGLISMAFGPISGRLADKYGKYKIFVVGSVITFIMVYIYTNMGVTPFWIVVTANVFFFAGIMSRMIAAQALITGVPLPEDRGAFMSVNASVQQISGGIASWIAGSVVIQTSTKLEHYDTLGFIVMGVTVISIALMWVIARRVNDPVEFGAAGTRPA